MREWMMGCVDAWINPSSRPVCGRRPSFYRALGNSNSHMDFLFLYEDGKLIAVKNIKSWLAEFTEKHGRRDPSLMKPDDVHYYTYINLDQNPWLREPAEQELLALLIPERQ